MADPARLAAMGQRARLAAENKYSRRKIIGQYQALLE